MNPISALIASTGLCASRAFLPAFIAALLLRFGSGNAGAEEAAASLVGTAHAATWFTSNACLIILGVLAGLELVAQRSHDARAILAEIDHWAKPVMAAVTFLGLISPADAAFAAKMAPHEAGILTQSISIVVGAVTYTIAAARNVALQLLHDIDADNSTGIHSIIAWGEDLYAVFGMLFVILFPIFVAAIILSGIGLIYLLKKRAEAREDAARTTCGSCAVRMYRSAVACPSCRTANPTPCSIDWLGVATASPADASTQPDLLRSKWRCPSCATRLTERTPAQQCSACSRAVFANAEEVRAYDQMIHARLAPTLLLCAALSLIPIAGLIIGVLVYRMRLMAPYRCYVPRGRSMVLRWGLRLVQFLLIFVQIVPLVGAVAVPLMAWLGHSVFRRAFLSLATDREETAAAAPLPA